MKKLLILTILYGLFSCSSNANSSGKNLPDKKTMSVIKKAEKVVLYLIDPMTDDFSKGKIQGFALAESEPKTLSKSDKDTLLSLIYENSNRYKDNGTGKLSAFIPNVGFKFINEKDTVDLLIDLHSDIWKYHCGKTTFSTRFDSVHNEIENLLLQLYPINTIEDCSDKESILPKEILSELDSWIYGEWFILDPLETITEKDSTFNGFYVLQTKTDKHYLNSVTNLLTDKSSFAKTEMIKNCMFLPDIAVRLHNSENKIVDVMFSFYCDECKFICGENVFQSDCSLIRSKILQYAKLIFPNDRYIRVLSNQKH